MNISPRLKKFLYLVAVILVTTIVFILGVIITEQNFIWFQSINKPICQPPNYFFYVVWTVLFIMIAASAIIVLNKSETQKKQCNLAIILYILNAFLATLFSYLFFTVQNIMLAMIEMPFLLASIILLIFCVYRISKIASYLLIPYLLWVCFATYLVGALLFIN